MSIDNCIKIDTEAMDMIIDYYDKVICAVEPHIEYGKYYYINKQYLTGLYQYTKLINKNAIKG